MFEVMFVIFVNVIIIVIFECASSCLNFYQQVPIFMQMHANEYKLQLLLFRPTGAYECHGNNNIQMLPSELARIHLHKL